MSDGNRRRGRPKSFDGKAASKNTIQSLERALDVLNVLANSDGMTLSEIATQMKQSPSTIYRILNTMMQRGIVDCDTHSQAWYIGAEAFRLGSSFLRRRNILERSRPVMRQLMEATGETANLGIEQSNKVLFVSQVETHESIRAFFPPGTQSPMHASGIGKALLSTYLPERLDRYLREIDLEKFTEQTITDPDELRRELATIKTNGVAYDNGERTPGMTCIASPIINSYGETVAGISISGPDQRMTKEKIEEISVYVRDAAKSLR